MTPSIEELKEFMVRVGNTYAETLSVIEAEDDPVPTLIVENEQAHNVFMFPTGMAGPEDKDILFGKIFPAVIDEHSGERAAFLSFAWQTEITEDEREELRAYLEAHDVDTGDDVEVHRILTEELGVQISHPSRRKEICQMVAVSEFAEAMCGASVIRDGGPPRIEWDFTDLDEDDPSANGLRIQDRDHPNGISGRVPDGLRAGIDSVVNRVHDWRSDA